MFVNYQGEQIEVEEIDFNATTKEYQVKYEDELLTIPASDVVEPEPEQAPEQTTKPWAALIIFVLLLTNG